jgi:ParB family chromosome partitioning protein
MTIPIDIISEDEKQAAAARFMQLSQKAEQLTDEEKNFIFDAGYYNSAVQGYLILAMKKAGFEKEDIRNALTGLHYAMDVASVAEAARVEL